MTAGSPAATYAAFDGSRLLARGPLRRVAVAVQRASAGAAGPILVFGDHDGRVVDLDLRGTEADVLSRYPVDDAPAGVVEPAEASATRGRGRPRLGVVAREVTLLPRHWDWLAAQPGGASVALRKLVEAARRDSADVDARRARHEAAYRVMAALAGDLPGFEEASRALFADATERFAESAAGWPADVRGYVEGLAFGASGG